MFPDFSVILVAFWCCFALSTLPILVYQHLTLHQNATEMPAKWPLFIYNLKNLNKKLNKVHLKYKIVGNLMIY